MTVDVTVLPGLPPYGEPATNFSVAGGSLHSEGLVVQFRLNHVSSWSGNFARGLTKFNLAVPHPNGHDALIIADGQGYLVNPVDKRLLGTFGGAIVQVLAHPTPPAIVLNHQQLWFEAIGADGALWKSRRISWDGFRSVSVSGAILKGEAWRYDDTWHPFQLNLQTGEVSGGSYEPASQ